MKEDTTVSREEIADERNTLVARIEDWLDMPMLVLGFVWLGLLIYELIWTLSPELELAGTIIWVIFIIDFSVKFILAPDKILYVKSNWLTALSLIVPALRVLRAFRVFRLVHTARGLRLFRVVTSINRGMKALGESFSRRGFGYIIALSIVIIFAGAAGMLTFENEVDGGIKTYGEALWWTAMLLTSIGSDYFPRTAEGRILCFLLALYGFAVFGYVTATLATFFVGRDAEDKASAIAGAEDVRMLSGEIALLREELNDLRKSIGNS